MKVQNMTTANGNKALNQFIIRDGTRCEQFQSYETTIVEKTRIDGQLVVTLDVDSWDYGVTTGRYRNLYLGETKKETQKKIYSGEYRLANLNPVASWQWRL